MGIGGATQATDSNTMSAFYNPAGLAYVTSPTMAAAFRNLPESNTVLSGKLNNPSMDTSRDHGSKKVSHVGFAWPVKGGTLGISFTKGGAILDSRTQTTLTDDQNREIRQYSRTLKAETDFFNISFGKSGRNGVNYGAGLVFANQYLFDSEKYRVVIVQGQTITVDNGSPSGNLTGIGAIFGVQFPTSQDQKSMVGLSVRTPIQLQGNDRLKNYMNKLPGRASLGLATRTDGLRGGPDFLVYGAQLDYFFGSDKNGFFKRKDVLGGGVGFEYNMHRYGGRIPIRAGFSVSPSAGDGFQTRNSLTFGVGYRPNSGGVTFDLNGGLPSGGGAMDLGLSVSYKIGN